jgi:hypothetical protein
MALGLTQPLTKMSTRSRKIMFLGSKARPVCRADNITAISETMWDPQDRTNLQTSTACYGDSFTIWRRSVLPVRYELDCKYCYK